MTKNFPSTSRIQFIIIRLCKTFESWRYVKFDVISLKFISMSIKNILLINLSSYYYFINHHTIKAYILTEFLVFLFGCVLKKKKFTNESINTIIFYAWLHVLKIIHK